MKREFGRLTISGRRFFILSVLSSWRCSPSLSRSPVASAGDRFADLVVV
ncbi:hypothetical protein [Methanosphaerula palustris]|nr:hypothetical protein [Methanosphaerula palustris]